MSPPPGDPLLLFPDGKLLVGKQGPAHLRQRPSPGWAETALSGSVALLGAIGRGPAGALEASEPESSRS